MATLGAWIRRLLYLINRSRMEEDLRREMETHREMLGDRARFGNTLRLRDEARDAWGWSWLDTFVRDARQGVRQLRRAPGFAVVAISTLGLGIGASTAVFSTVNAALLRPFPFHDPDRLMTVVQIAGDRVTTVSPADFQDWRDSVRRIELAAYVEWSPTLTGAGDPEQIPAFRVSSELFAVLGVAPSLGLTRSQPPEPGSPPSIVISDALWRRGFGADAGVVGRSVRLDGQPYLIAAVMPRDFAFPNRETELWAPLPLDRARRDRGEHSLLVVGRLAPGVAREQAAQELGTLSAAIASRFARTGAASRTAVIPLREWHVGDRARQSMWVLLGAVTLLMLMGCFNVANLLLARSATREREMAMRAALGAGRGALAGQLFTEALVLAGMGGAAGLALAYLTQGVMRELLPASLATGLGAVAIDWRVLVYAAMASVVSSVVFAVAPAVLSIGRTQTASRATGHTSRSRWSQRLLAVEALLTVVLLVAAGLLIRSWLQVWSIPAGFDPAHVVTARLTLSPPRYTGPSQIAEFYERVLASLARTPSMQATGAVSNLPLAGFTNSSAVTLEERPSPTPEEQPSADRLVVTPGYFPALRITIREGRVFSDRDVQGAPLVVIVNESFARRHWPHASAVGRRIRRGTAIATHFPFMTIVGVVADVKHDALEAGVRPTFYLPFAQNPTNAMTIVVRTATDPADAIAGIRRAVRQSDPDQPITAGRTLDMVVLSSISQRRLPAIWLGAFAALACLLAAIGVYGLVTYAVASRRREIGVRLALGCSPTIQVRDVIWRGVRPVLIGAVAGVVAAAALSTLVAGLLFEVGPRDAVSFGLAFMLPVVSAIVAGVVPARHAARVDPVRTLREE
jgi:predicted permease